MANATKRPIGFQVRSSRLGISIYYGDSFTPNEIDARVRILTDVETAYKKGRKINSDVYDDLVHLNDPKLIDALEKRGIIAVSKVLTLGEMAEQALEYFAKMGTKPQTINMIRKSLDYLYDFMGKDQPISTINKQDARDFDKWFRSQSLKASTVNRRIGHVKQIFNWAVKKLDDDIRNPFVCLDNIDTGEKKEKSVVSDEQKTAILDALNKTDQPEFWTAWFMFGYHQGLRLWSEAPRIRWSMIDFDTNKYIKGEIMIIDAKNSKRRTRKVRYMPLHKDTREALLRLKKYQEENEIETGDYVFPELWKIPGVEQVKETTMKARYRRILKRSNLSYPDPAGALRRTASNYWEKNAGVEAENEFLGHTKDIAKKHYYDEKTTPLSVVEAVNRSQREPAEVC